MSWLFLGLFHFSFPAYRTSKRMGWDIETPTPLQGANSVWRTTEAQGAPWREFQRAEVLRLRTEAGEPVPQDRSPSQFRGKPRLLGLCEEPKNDTNTRFGATIFTACKNEDCYFGFCVHFRQSSNHSPS